MHLPALLTITILAAGCAPAADDADTATEDTDAEDPGVDTTYAADGFETCSDGATGEEIADSVLLTVEYGASLHEMVACGALLWQLCTDIAIGVVSAIIDGQAHAMPEGWSYDGEGDYTTVSKSTTMTTGLYTTRDYAFAQSGERITENVFLIDNYLSGISIDINWTTGSPELSYDETGPLVELLGFGASPDNPMSLSESDLSTVYNSLGSIAFDSAVVVEDVREYGTIKYELETSLQEVLEFLGDGEMRYDLIKADGVRSDLDQTLTVEDWGIDFVGGSVGELLGSSVYRVEGGHFDYRGEIHFENSKVGDTTLTCP